MMVNPIVFVCVGREDGCTKELVATALEGCPYTLIDLGTKNFSDHDPKGQNSGDDFLHMAEQMVQHNPIILACPVYWYSVPAIVKRFVDRWGDLLDGRKDIARKLQGKKMFVIAPYGTYPDGIAGFEEPLKNTANYMSMHYSGTLFHYTGEDPQGIAENLPRMAEFRKRLLG
jgi:putative NADPH-quinone reductase